MRAQRRLRPGRPRVAFFAVAGLIATFTLVASLVATSARSAPTASAAKPTGKPIVIGAVVAKSGFFRYLDYPQALAAKMAIDDINRAGGVLGRPLKYVIVDNKSDAATGSTAALSAIQKGAAWALVPCTPDLAAPASVVFGSRGIASMSVCAAAPEFGANGRPPLAFTTTISTPTEASAAAEWLVSKRRLRTAWVLEDTTLTYTTSWVDSFNQAYKAYGGRVIGEDTFKNPDASIATQISRLKSSATKPSAVAICSYPPGGASAVRQLRAADINVPIILCAGMEGLDWLPSVPGVTNVYMMTHADFLGHDPDPAVNRFYKRFTRVTGWKLARSHAIEGYCAIQLFAKAAKNAGSVKGKAINAAMEKFRNVKCIVGPTTYTSKWHIPFRRPIVIEEARNGTFRFVAKFIPKKIFPPKI